jgi:hypothetical protein
VRSTTPNAIVPRLADLGVPGGIANLQSLVPRLPLEDLEDLDLSKALATHELAARLLLLSSPRGIADSTTRKV